MEFKFGEVVSISSYDYGGVCKTGIFGFVDEKSGNYFVRPVEKEHRDEELAKYFGVKYEDCNTEENAKMGKHIYYLCFYPHEITKKEEN